MSTPTPVDFIPVLLPDGSLPEEAQAFVSAQVQQEAGQFVTDAQAAQAAAEAARDAALAAVPHIIVGAGRPDIAGTLAPDVASRVQNAPSGTVFRSTDGPQGAWEWRKKGSAWSIIDGDTALRDISDLCLVPASTKKFYIIRSGNSVQLSADAFTPSESVPNFGHILTLPLGFRPRTEQRSVGYEIAKVYTASRSQLLAGAPIPAGTTSRFGMFWYTPDAWPTTLPGTA